MIKVGIIGTSSLTSGEVLKILLKHSKVKLTYFESEHFTGKKVWETHRFLKGILDLPLKPFSEEEIAGNCSVVFISKQHDYASKVSRNLIAKGVKIIDLGADFRLKDCDVYKKWYGVDHKDHALIKIAVYGLPEIYGDKIKKAMLVANPGCYPTSIILGCNPLIKNKLVDLKDIIVSSYSGISGAGRFAKPGMNLFMDGYRNLFPYNVAMHRHTPEIEQELSGIAGSQVNVTFVPHVAPLDKGILSTIYLKPVKKCSEDEIRELYNESYRKCPYVRIYDSGEFPSTLNVVDTNFCDIGIKYDERNNRIIIVSAIDNLVKGAAGQAVQNMNIMMGLDETEGLPVGKTIK